MGGGGGEEQGTSGRKQAPGDGNAFKAMEKRIAPCVVCLPKAEQGPVSKNAKTDVVSF